MFRSSINPHVNFHPLGFISFQAMVSPARAVKFPHFPQLAVIDYQLNQFFGFPIENLADSQ